MGVCVCVWGGDTLLPGLSNCRGGREGTGDPGGSPTRVSKEIWPRPLLGQPVQVPLPRGALLSPYPHASDRPRPQGVGPVFDPKELMGGTHRLR